MPLLPQLLDRSPAPPRVLLPPSFPDAESPGLYRGEWWYWYGHLRPTDGSAGEWSYIGVVLRNRFGTPLGWSTQHLALLQLIDVARTERVGIIEFPAGAEASVLPTAPGRFNLRFSPFLATAVGDRYLYASGSRGRHQFVARDGFGLRLDFEDRGAPALVGEGGIVSYAPDCALTYYARPRMSAVGTLRVEGREIPVAGDAWMERQTGNADVRGLTWRYLPVMIGDDRWLFFHTRYEAHERTWGARLDADGTVRRLDPASLSVTSGDDRSLTSRVVAPGIDLTVEALACEQEINPATPLAPTFYEGFSRVRGEIHGASVAGVAMTEIHRETP